MCRLRFVSLATLVGGAASLLNWSCGEVAEHSHAGGCSPVTILSFQASSHQWRPGEYELTIRHPAGEERCSFRLNPGAAGAVSRCSARGAFSPKRSGGCTEVVGDAAAGGDCTSTVFDLVEYSRPEGTPTELDYRLLRDGAEVATGRASTQNACPGEACACERAVVDVSTH